MAELSGLIAIIEAGVVVEVRDLGPTPVPCKSNVLPLTGPERPTGTPTQIVEGPSYDIQVDQVVRSWNVRDMTAPELAAWKDGLADGLSRVDDIQRAFMLLVLDELNVRAERFNALRDAILNGSSLANVKTLVSASPAYPTRTEQQLRTGIRDKLGT